MSWLGFNLGAVRRGLFVGSAVGVAFVAATLVDEWGWL